MRTTAFRKLYLLKPKCCLSTKSLRTVSSKYSRNLYSMFQRLPDRSIFQINLSYRWHISPISNRISRMLETSHVRKTFTAFCIYLAHKRHKQLHSALFKILHKSWGKDGCSAHLRTCGSCLFHFIYFFAISSRKKYNTLLSAFVILSAFRLKYRSLFYSL